MNTNSRHDASGQLAGYLYQVLSALLLLLESTETRTQICIERFDDVSFGNDEKPSTRIQIKHKLYKQGNLNDTSVDLWRTINSWCDVIKTTTHNLTETKFLIITTASVKENTAVSYLVDLHNRNYKKALGILRNTAKSDVEGTNKKFYHAFLSLNSSQQEDLVKHMHIYACAPKIDGIKEAVMQYVKWTTLPQHADAVYDKIVGWWINSVIKCLCSPKPVFINSEELQSAMFDIGSEYKADSLPIDVNAFYNPTQEEVNELSPDNQIFIEQLKLIMISHERLSRCIRDYYNAYQQRSRWVREQLLFVDDLSKYEAALIDEWNRLFIIMKECLDDYGSSITDEQKVKAGRDLLSKIEELNIFIRERVTQPFIMRGTFQGLANQLKVGWHIDFADRLHHLLKG